MSVPAVDETAAPLAGALLEALLVSYDAPDAGVAGPCVAGLLSGSNLIADHCCAGTDAAGQPCEGQLTVRVVNVYPTDAFPAPRADAIPMCGTSWAVELEVAVLRCALGVDTDVVPPRVPTMAEEMAVAERALADRALTVGTVLEFAADRDQAVVLGPFVPMGPDGGCVGGAFNATFLIE